MTWLRLAPALGLAIVTQATAAGSIQRWTDAAGQVHYGDRPPAGVDAQPVEVRPGSTDTPADRTRRARTERLLEVIETERAERAAAEEKARAEREARAARCDRARRELAGVERAALLYVRDAAGERRYLDDGERGAAIEKLRAAVGHWCKGGGQ